MATARRECALARGRLAVIGSGHRTRRLLCSSVSADEGVGGGDDEHEDVLGSMTVTEAVRALEKKYRGGDPSGEVERLVAHDAGAPASEEELRQRLYAAVEQAFDACALDSATECATAWDKVEELSLAAERRSLVRRALSGARGREIPADRPSWTRSASDPLRASSPRSDAEQQLDAWKQRQGRGLLEGQDLLQGVTPSDTGQTEPPTGSLRQAGRLERSLGPGSVSDTASSSATPPNSSPEQQMRKRLLDSEINEAVTNAADKCELGSEQSCDEAWERVESLSQERDRIDDVG